MNYSNSEKEGKMERPLRIGRGQGAKEAAKDF